MIKQTILVTGGAGFIGSHTCERLLDLGYYVINIDNFNNYYDIKIKERNIQKAINHPNYELIKGDILDIKLLERVFHSRQIDKIVHLAAMAGVRNSIQDPANYVDIDIKGTVNLLDMAKNYNVKRFLFASSSSVYGINQKLPFSESDPVNLQISPYATAKRSGELFCYTYNHLYNLSIGMLRFFTVYGPRQRPEMAIYKFTENIINGRAISVFGKGDSSRDYTYIDDIVEGIVSALNTEYNCEVFNLGNSYTITLNNLISLIEDTVGKKAIIDHLPIQTGDVPTTFSNISKAQRLLGYDPNVKMEQGISNFIKWYKAL